MIAETALFLHHETNLFLSPPVFVTPYPFPPSFLLTVFYCESLLLWSWPPVIAKQTQARIETVDGFAHFSPFVLSVCHSIWRCLLPVTLFCPIHTAASSRYFVLAFRQPVTVRNFADCARSLRLRLCPFYRSHCLQASQSGTKTSGLLVPYGPIRQLLWPLLLLFVCCPCIGQRRLSER